MNVNKLAFFCFAGAAVSAVIALVLDPPIALQDYNKVQRQYARTHDCTLIFHHVGESQWDMMTNTVTTTKGWSQYLCHNPEVVLVPNDEESK